MLDGLQVIDHRKDAPLRDVARVERGYVDPQDRILRYDGNLAIGLGVSTVSGGNVVAMGEAIAQYRTEMG